MCVCMIFVRMNMCVCVRECGHVRIHTCGHVCIHMCMCYICAFSCVREIYYAYLVPVILVVVNRCRSLEPSFQF